MRKTAGDNTHPWPTDPLRVDPWVRTVTSLTQFWLSFWPVAPLFGVEWRFAEMGHSLDPAKGPPNERQAAKRAAPTGKGPEAVPEAAPVTVPAAEPEAPADDLTRIKGIGPGLARQLDALGIRRFAQIAALSPAELEALDARLTTLPGRCVRDDWVGQARALAG